MSPDPQPPPGQYEMGYIYRDNTQIAAVANCCVEMHQLLDHAAIDYNGWKVWHTSGPIETTISGDLFPLENENESSTYEAAQFSLKMGDETLRIILAFPQGDMKIDAEGYITSTTIESSMDSPLVHSFTFQVMGEIQMLYT